MLEGQVAINTWDILFMIIGVVLYVILLMMANGNTILMDMMVSGCWLMHVLLVMLLTSRTQVLWDSGNTTTTMRAINQLNLGMAMCSLLYHMSVIITRDTGYSMSPFV